MNKMNTYAKINKESLCSIKRGDNFHNSKFVDKITGLPLNRSRDWPNMSKSSPPKLIISFEMINKKVINLSHIKQRSSMVSLIKF